MRLVSVRFELITSGRGLVGRANAKRDGTRAETRIGLSAKRTSPFQSAGWSVQSTTGSRAVWNVDARRLATHSIRIFPLHFPFRASPCAIRSRVSYTYVIGLVTCYIHVLAALTQRTSTRYLSDRRVGWLSLSHCPILRQP